MYRNIQYLLHSNKKKIIIIIIMRDVFGWFIDDMVDHFQAKGEHRKGELGLLQHGRQSKPKETNDTRTEIIDPNHAGPTFGTWGCIYGFTL